MTINQAILATVREVDATTPVEEVTEVAELDSAPEPDAPEKANKREANLEKLRAEFLAAGCNPAKVDELVAFKQVIGSRQRVAPTWAPVCALETIAFWKDRSDEQIEQDMTKLLRRDGGQQGPAAAYAQIIWDTIVIDESEPLNVDLLYAKEAGDKVNDHVGRRLYSARVYVTMAINELRRRRAVRAGVDPKSITYLKVTAPDSVGAAPESADSVDADLLAKAKAPRKNGKRGNPPVPPLTDEEMVDPDVIEAIAFMDSTRNLLSPDDYVRSVRAVTESVRRGRTQTSNCVEESSATEVQ